MYIYVLLPTSGVSISSFWYVQVVHWAVQIRLHSNIFLQPPAFFLSVRPLTPYVLALAFPFYPFFYFCLVPTNFLYGRQYLCSCSLFLKILPYFLD